MNSHNNIQSKTVLLTGGAGYIGSHTFVALVAAGYTPVILDDFSNSQPAVLERLEHLTGQSVLCERGNVLDTGFVEQVLQRHNCAAVVHFADFKAVGESVNEPLNYYSNSVGGLISLLQAVANAGCKSIVFSSTATVYGDPVSVPVNALSPCAPQRPYAQTKLMGEHILASLQDADKTWRVAVLRYLNPVGVHTSGLIGEDPIGIPNNLMHYVSHVVVGKREKVLVYGHNYPTPNGTGVRDYLHVLDLVEGHVAAVSALLSRHSSFTVNLGTGHGTSVLGVSKAFENASGKPVPFEFVPRRAGDVESYYADVSLANTLLGWRASRTIDDMCGDAWRWQQSRASGHHRKGSAAWTVKQHHYQNE